MSTEQNPQVRRPQTLNPQDPGSGTSSVTSSSGAPSGMRGAAKTYGLNSRPSGIRPLPELPPGKDVTFAHFGLLNAGEQSKSSLFTSGVVNVTLAVIICIIGAAAKKVHDQHVLLTNLTEPIPVKKQEQEKPKPKPPTPKIEPPKIVIQQPKLELPKILQVKLDQPKPPTPQVHMAVPLPVIAAAPLKVNAPPAPKQLALGGAALPAKVIQSDPNHIASLNQAMKSAQQDRTARSILFSNAGAPGGTVITRQTTTLGGLGNGTAGGTGSGSRRATSISGLGIPGGVPGGTGTGRGVSAVSIGPLVNNAPVQQQRATPLGAVKPLKVTSKLEPACTDDAKRAHIEGQVILNVNFSAGGRVQVLGVARGLGHGLDQAAEAAAQQIRFDPQTVDGRAVDVREAIAASFSCSAQ